MFLVSHCYRKLVFYINYSDYWFSVTSETYIQIVNRKGHQEQSQLSLRQESLSKIHDLAHPRQVHWTFCYRETSARSFSLANSVVWNKIRNVKASCLLNTRAGIGNCLVCLVLFNWSKYFGKALVFSVSFADDKKSAKITSANFHATWLDFLFKNVKFIARRLYLLL